MAKVPVTFRAVIQRLNRVLAKEENVLKKARGQGVVWREFGDYYILNWRSNFVETYHVDPVALAQELGVLQPWETVEGEDAAPPEPPPVLDAPPFDANKFRLGSLCQHGHAFRDTGQSLRRMVSGACVACAKNQRKGP